MALNSGQYADLLLERLRRSFRVYGSDGMVRRVFYSNFFQQLLTHPSVTITEESYNAFATLMDNEMTYVTSKGYQNFQQIYNDSRKEKQWIFMRNCFAQIGISLAWEQRINDAITRTEEIPTITDGNYTRTFIIFILPDASEMELNAGTMYDNVYINTYVCTTYPYAQSILPYYEIEPARDTPDIAGTPLVAGTGTTWEYDPDTQTLEIGGTGKLVRSTLFTSSSYYGLTVSRLIIGAGVDGLDDYYNSGYDATGVVTSLSYTGEKTIVYLRGTNDPCRLSAPYFGVDTHWSVYTDNIQFRETVASWANDKFTVEFHALSEWGASSPPVTGGQPGSTPGGNMGPWDDFGDDLFG